MANRVFDLIVLGSGGAGLGAALAAAGEGMSVCLLEKGPHIGGGTATSYGTIWAPANQLAAQAGLPDDLTQGMAYAEFCAGGTALATNLATYVNNASRVMDRLMSWGVGLELALGLPDAFYPHGHGSCGDGRRMIQAAPIQRSAMGEWADLLRPAYYCPPGVSWGDVARWGGFANRRNWDANELARRENEGWLAAGQGLVAQLLVAFLKLGGQLQLNAGATELVFSEQRVVGVRIASTDTTYEARHGVVLACGGYEGNAELVQRFEGLPNWLNPFAPTNQGDGMVMATEHGAAIYRSAVNHGLLVGCAIPTRDNEFFSIGLHGMPYPGAIAVNQQGERFCDESRFQEVVHAFHHFDRAKHRFINLPAHMVFDDRYRQQYAIAGAPPGQAAPDWVAQAPTLEALAAQIGVAATGLLKTVERFNHFATDGEDLDFGRGKSAFSKSTAGDANKGKYAQLGPLDTPPYYAIPLRVGGIVGTGLLTNEHAQVMHVRGHPIAGLYACGNTAAPTDTGVGYQGGASIGSGVIFGCLAAEHAAQARH